MLDKHVVLNKNYPIIIQDENNNNNNNDPEIADRDESHDENKDKNNNEEFPLCSICLQCIGGEFKSMVFYGDS